MANPALTVTNPVAQDLRIIRRHAEAPILASLQRFPVVLLLGARGVGKSTLLRSLCETVWRAPYFDLEEPAVRAAAHSDAGQFLSAAGEPVVLDGIEWAPDLIPAIEKRIGWDLRPGRYLVAASANLFPRALAQTLAGRATVHPLLPLSWGEAFGRSPCAALDRLFQVETATDLLASLPIYSPMGRSQEIRRMILTGGLPAPVLLDSAASRHRWFTSYLETLVGDLRRLASLRKLEQFDRVLRAFGRRTEWILNLSEVAAELRLPVSTIRRHFRLLQRTYQMQALPRLSSADGAHPARPKLYLADTGLVCHLEAVDAWDDLVQRARCEAVLKTWVHGELSKLIATSSLPTALHYWRQRDREVDFVVERGAAAVGIQVKWSASLGRRALREMDFFRRSMGRVWHLGVVLHGGTDAVLLDDSTVALPLGVLLGREETGSLVA